MVKTSDDVMDTPPLERMDTLRDISDEKKNTISAKKKELEELQFKKKKEIEEIETKKKKEIDELDLRKKKELDELDKKKKEFEDLEKKKAEEIEETENLIEKSFQDLMRHKRKIIAEEEEIEKEKNLELLAEAAKPTSDKMPDYTKFIENLEPPKKLYDITNNGFYSSLTELREKAIRGEITPQQEEFVGKLRDQFESFRQNPQYVENDKKNYIQRSLKVIEDIDVSVYYR